MGTGTITETIVQTRQGKVRGATANGISAFKGIPYAAPPFGAGRLRPPRRHDSWIGVRDAREYGATPPAVPMPHVADGYIPNPMIGGDECLNLNIWAPELGTGSGLPVMVWIPGGQFEFGSGAAYDGSSFARDGVVCVTINYRSGAEGFLFLDDGVANVGLLDQIAALQWVGENIGAFGGNPDMVTVFGESAGAMSIGTLLAMPSAFGLFTRAILQSGAAHFALLPETAARIGRMLAGKLGVKPTRDAFASMPVRTFIQAQMELKADIIAHPDPARWGVDVVLSTMQWQPVIDGTLLSRRPIESIVAGTAANVDILIGTNTDEWRLFLVITGAIEHVTEAQVLGIVGAYGLPPQAALAAYRARHPDATSGDLLAALESDWWMHVPAIRLADAHAQSGAASTYMYEFVWSSQKLGACHGLEVPFVFDSFEKGTELLVGPNPPKELASRMHAAWIRFASTGECPWPRYDTERRATMRFGTRPNDVVYDPRRVERQLWNEIR